MSAAVQQKPASEDRSSVPPSSTGSIPSLKVEPLHHPEEMARVEVPHNVENIPHGTTLPTGKALLAKKIADTGTAFYSPSDALVSPCTKKLAQQKGKRWANAKVKPAVFEKSNLNTSSIPGSEEEPQVEADALKPTEAITDSTVASETSLSEQPSPEIGSKP